MCREAVFLSPDRKAAFLHFYKKLQPLTANRCDDGLIFVSLKMPHPANFFRRAGHNFLLLWSVYLFPNRYLKSSYPKETMLRVVPLAVRAKIAGRGTPLKVLFLQVV